MCVWAPLLLIITSDAISGTFLCLLSLSLALAAMTEVTKPSLRRLISLLAVPRSACSCSSRSRSRCTSCWHDTFCL